MKKYKDLTIYSDTRSKVSFNLNVAEKRSKVTITVVPRDLEAFPKDMTMYFVPEIKLHQDILRLMGLLVEDETTSRPLVKGILCREATSVAPFFLFEGIS